MDATKQTLPQQNGPRSTEKQYTIQRTFTPETKSSLTKKQRKNELQTLEEIPKRPEILLYINPISKPKSF